MIHFIESENRNGGKRNYWLGTYHHIDQLRKVLSKGKRAYMGEGWEYKECHATRISRDAYMALREHAKIWHNKVRNVENNRRRS